MRRRIELYIDGRLADLDKQDFILMNYALTDLQKPSAVKNSFSKQVTLPGTAANNRIFGNYGRVDRRTAGGFNALRKTPFVIYDERGQILEQGYVRLDSVLRSRDMVTAYKVTLFGGLGGLFYSLSYTAGGDKMTLADLDYLGTQTPSTELDFEIYAQEVSVAWQRLAGSVPEQLTSIWDVLNFAPAYDGNPDKDFDADKGVNSLAEMGLPAQTDYSEKRGLCRVNLSRKITAWEAKDLRSYLQRPVLSIRAFLEACVRYAATLGYTLDLSDINPVNFSRVYKTLPMIPTLGIYGGKEGTLTATPESSFTTSTEVGYWELSGIESYIGVQVSALLHFALLFEIGSNDVARLGNAIGDEATIIFVELVGENNGVTRGGGDIIVLGPDCDLAGNYCAEACGYTPSYAEGQYVYRRATVETVQSGQIKIAGDFDMRAKAVAADTFTLRVTAYFVTGGFYNAQSYIDSAQNRGVQAYFWTDGGTPYAATDARIDAQETEDGVTYSSAGAPKSGAYITKKDLLASKHTPADYLVSLAKMYGWLFLTEPATRTVRVLTRNTFYSGGGSDIDLSPMIDRSQTIEVKPLNVASKWYNFALDMAEGAYASQYKATYGVDYGIRRVDTGYDFDAADINLLDGNAFRTAASIQGRSKYFNICLDGSDCRPSPFLESGHTYTLWGDNDGKEQNFDVPALDPSAITMDYYNTLYNNYDADGVTRLELCDADGKQVDGEDILCYYTGVVNMPYFGITDDDQDMLDANGGKPCWYLNAGDVYGTDVPTFTRYKQSGITVNDMLDFGLPREADIPEVLFDAGSSMYARWWQSYLRDLLDVDTKVMRCRVNFYGMQVGQQLFRRFYYYEGAVWVLNKITNYSLTTYDPVECEFVQVQDKSTYTAGQASIETEEPEETQETEE